MNKLKNEIILSLLMFACVILLALDSNQFYARVDLTEDKVFTISDVTRTTLMSLPQRLNISYFISNELRQVSPVPGQIIDILQEYAAASSGKVKITIVDPAAGQAPEAIRRYGIFPQQMKVIKQNEQRVAEVYSGLVFEYLDRTIIIPFVFNPQTLEYSTTLTIRRIIRNAPTVVGILVGDPTKSLANDYSMIKAQLSLSFEVHNIVPGIEIPRDTSVLVVLGGTELPNEDMKYISDFIMNGGHVIFAVKALNVDTKEKLEAVPIESSPLLDMLSNFGIEVGKAMVLDTSARHYRLPQDNLGQIQWIDLGKYPEWVSVLSENVSLENPITRRFSGLDLMWPSPLHFNGQAGVNAQVIAKTTKNAWLMKSPFKTDPYVVTTMTGASDPTKGQYALVYALSGHFKNYFSKSGSSSSLEKETRAASPDVSLESKMLIIGDDDFASDLMAFPDSSYNALFLDNAVEWLSADADLLSIKTRNYHDQRLSRIQDQKAFDQHIVIAETVNLILIPVVVIVFGFVRAYQRREKIALRNRPERRSKDAQHSH
ncbi:MAG: GldG family protein [Rectinema subterraneum]|uniref:GldG family protein n=1 Tax=Rectinema subterraneum TaxID=2653714 RepID=UPI003C7D8C5F